MIYMEPSSLGWRDSILKSWLLKLKVREGDKTFVADLFLTIGGQALKFVKNNCAELIDTLESNLIVSCMDLFDSILPDGMQDVKKMFHLFVFAVVWSIGGAIVEADRPKFNQHLRSIVLEKSPTNELPFPNALVYEIVYDSIESKWKQWADQLSHDLNISDSTKYEEILVPTIETIRYSFLLKKLITNGKNVLLAGATGTGKSLYIKNVLNLQLDKEKFMPLFITFSAQTSANQTQDMIDSKLEKRKKGVFGPPNGKKFVLFVDDLSMVLH